MSGHGYGQRCSRADHGPTSTGHRASVAAGLERFAVEVIRVSVPHGAPARRGDGYAIRPTRLWRAEDRAPHGIPRARPAIAAVRGASGRAPTGKRRTSSRASSRTDSPARGPGTELMRIKRHQRRRLLHTVVNDLLDGGRAMGEIDLGRMLRSAACRRQLDRCCGRTSAAATTSTSTGPICASSSRSTGSTTPGPPTWLATPFGRTAWPSPATRCCDCRCSAYGCSNQKTSSTRSKRRSALLWPEGRRRWRMRSSRRHRKRSLERPVRMPLSLIRLSPGTKEGVGPE